MTKRTSLDSIANEIRTAIFVARDSAKASELIGKAEILVKAVRTAHERGLWAATIDGWKGEAARLG